ncbi:MAG: hypothetical protein J1F65_05840 [Clostridiales bacterium]|nr:hypothetical protein [Clostridiales bacterium]
MSSSASVQSQQKLRTKLSGGRLFGVILISLITAALIVCVFVTMFNDELLTLFGNKFALGARQLDESFPDTPETDYSYGKILCYGYLGIIPLGFLMLSCLLRNEKPRLHKMFLTFFIVFSIIADVLYVVLTWKVFPVIDAVELEGDVYKLLRFIPIPTLFAGGIVRFSRVVIYRGFPLLAQVLMVLPYALLRRFKPRFYEFLNFMAFLILVGFMPILENYVFVTAIACAIIFGILWAIKGFFTVDTGSVVRTSDGTVLHQVDGDTYSDGNGNYYSYDGNTFRPK